MNQYASRWESCTKEEYFAIYNDTLTVYSSYTNPDGNDGLSSRPQMQTTWGDQEKELINCIATRTREQAEDKTKWEWDYKYFKAIGWEE